MEVLSASDRGAPVVAQSDGLRGYGARAIKKEPCLLIKSTNASHPAAWLRCGVRTISKGGSFHDLPLTRELSDSLGGWFAFVERVKGVRLRQGEGVNFAESAPSFLAGTARSFSNKAFNARHKLACRARSGTGYFRSPPASYGAAATLLLNEWGANLRDVQVLLGHKSIATTAAIRTLIPGGCARSWETSDSHS
jgi:integrase